MRIISLLILLTCVFSCDRKGTQSKDNITAGEIIIEGQITEGGEQLVTLDMMGSSAFIPLDSARCDADGNFKLSFEGEGVNFYALKYTEHGYITVIAKPGDRITIRGNSASLYPYSVEGSEATELVRKLAEAHNRVLDELRDISKRSEEIIGEVDFAEKKQALNDRFDSITNAFHEFSKEFILANPESPAILIALYNQFGPGLPVFHPLTDLEIYQYTDSLLYTNYPENEAVRSLHSQLAAALQQLRNQENEKGLEKGDRAHDFVIERANGLEMALSDLQGKYVLLQIWASWSKPSAEETRFVEEAYHRFGDKDFAIMQVSIDDDREEWKKALKAEKPGWYQVSDLSRWESVVVNLYRVERIPANFLISPNGTILGKDMFGDELVNTIQKYIQ